MQKKKDFKKHFETLQLAAYVGNIGFAVVFCILLFFLAGYFLDEFLVKQGILQTKGIFLTLGILIGIFTGGWSAYKIIMDMDAKFGPAKPPSESEKEIIDANTEDK